MAVGLRDFGLGLVNSYETGSLKNHLITAIMTNRIIGGTTSTIVINQCLRFNKRFFHDITRNFDPILFKLIL